MQTFGHLKSFSAVEPASLAVQPEPLTVTLNREDGTYTIGNGKNAITIDRNGEIIGRDFRDPTDAGFKKFFQQLENLQDGQRPLYNDLNQDEIRDFQGTKDKFFNLNKSREKDAPESKNSPAPSL